MGSSTDDSVYGAWLNFEYPIFWNREAKSQRRRTELQFMLQQREFEDIVEQVGLDVKQAVRVLEANARALHLARQAINESLREVAYRESRQRLAPQRNAQPSVTLDLLLRAQQRLGQAQLDYIESLSKYNRALVQLRRATGELVETVW